MLLPILFLPLVAAAPLSPSTLDNYIVDIENGTLKDVRFRGQPVTSLDLSGQGIRHLQKNALDNVSSLRSLNLANNSLESLPEFLFSNLTNLEYLSLAENKLTSLEYLFVRLENLRLLNISCNPVMHLRRGHLFGLTKSARILTDGNIFWSISTGTFANSFLKDEEESKHLEKFQGEVDLAQASEATEKEVEEATTEASTLQRNDNSSPEPKHRIRGGEKLKLCMPNQIVLSIEPLGENKSVANGCLEIPIDEKERSVNLRGLGIKGFQEGWYMLRDYPIATLDLGNNEISEITRELLNDLPADLAYVNLMENRIRNIWSQVIENRYLRMLNLRDNLIASVEEAAFANTSLTTLLLNGNQLEDLSFVSSLPKTLSELVLARNQISAIPADTFANLSRLIYLNLANNKIQTLRDNVFKGLDSLKVLIITKNTLTEIEREAFRDLKQLTTLYLHRNSLQSLRKGTFSELPSLKDLNLAWNRLRTIGQETFADLPKSLDFLHIDFNEIDRLEAGSFVGVPRFTLSLTGNKISSIPRGTFDLPTLKDLHLNNNTLTTIDGDSYEGLPQLKRLWLNENRIREIPRGSCKNLASLNILDISKNPFEKLENAALYGLSTARGNFLYIYTNRLKELQAGVFEDV